MSKIRQLPLRENAPHICIILHSSAATRSLALGHHYDDVIETILGGNAHGAQVQTMAAEASRASTSRAWS